MTQRNATLSNEYLTLDQVLARVGNPHRSTVWRWIRRGLFPSPRRRLGQRRMLWLEDEIDRWLDEQNLTKATSQDVAF
jgi:predicted DNA-binding transcriptional regulator AlpA